MASWDPPGFGRLVNGHSFELPGDRKWHLGLNSADELRRNRWVRFSSVQEIVGSKLRFTGTVEVQTSTTTILRMYS